MRKCLGLFLFLFCSLIGTPTSFAHPLAPALLEIKELSPGSLDVLWKTPLLGGAGQQVQPLFPSSCRMQEAFHTTRVDMALESRGKFSCAASLVGQTITLNGLSEGLSNAIVRLSLSDGRTYQVVLNAKSSTFQVPPRPLATVVFKDYLKLGFEHILSGWDHLFFVLGLLMLVRGKKLLLWTITAFTLGHSVTLSLAVLGLVHVPQAPVEALIALSILVLAIELTRRQEGKGTFFHRFPWAMAFSFGLLHGLGFAGALAEVGLPVGEIPMALFSFNVGIELGQLAFIAAILMLEFFMLRIAGLSTARMWRVQQASVYVIGSLSAYWFFERLSSLR